MMAKWLEGTLGAVCDEGRGAIRTGPFGSQLHQSDYQSEGIPVVMPKDIVDNKISVNSIARVGKDDVTRLSQHILQEGDIVYGRRGDIGRQALVTRREAGWLCGTGCIRLNLGKSPLDPVFLHYYLQKSDVISWIYNQAIGATMPNLNSSILRSVPVRFPPIPIQRKITAVLSAYDDLIENNLRRIKILEEMAQNLYREWFVNFRYPGWENGRVGDSPLGPIPEGWEVRILGEAIEIFRGRSYRSVDLANEGGLPFLNLKCIDRDGGFRRTGLKRYIGEYKNTHIAKKGDIIIAVTDMTQERRIVARAALVPSLDKGFGICSMDLVRIEPKPPMPKMFLYSLLRYSSFADELKQYANGANVLHLTPERIADFQFAVPPTDLMLSFANFVIPSLEQMNTLENKNEALRQTRDLLLPKLISGELDVSELDITIPQEDNEL
jgi:type I restriction enzyme, S subunit